MVAVTRVPHVKLLFGILEVNNICSQYSIPCNVDYNKEPFISRSEPLYNNGHVNKKGVKIYTKPLICAIKTKFNNFLLYLFHILKKVCIFAKYYLQKSYQHNKNMIPKIIHYCWLSGEPYPEKIQECIDSWKEVLPDYNFKLWDMTNFDINSVDFVKEAVSVKKWAFAADYIRLYALYTEGGIYLDSDVLVKKSFNSFLYNDFFSAVEYHPYCIQENNTLTLLNEDGSSKIRGQRKPGIGLQAAVIGSIPKHPYIKDVMKWYNNNHFILQDGSYNNEFIAPDVLAMFAEEYGFKFVNKEQRIQNNMLIVPSNVIAGNVGFDINDNTVAIHLTLNSWKPKPTKEGFISRLIKKIKYNRFISYWI